MKLKNNSTRPHWVGDVLIAPGAVAEVKDEYKNAFNKRELEEIEAQEVKEQQDSPKRGRPPKVALDDAA